MEREWSAPVPRTLTPPDAKDEWGTKAPDDRQQDSGCKKATSKRDTPIQDGAKLRRVGPDVVSLGAYLFTDVA